MHNALNAIAKSKNFNSNVIKSSREINDESLISPKLQRKTDTGLSGNGQTKNSHPSSPSISSNSSPPSAQSPVQTDQQLQKPQATVEKSAIGSSNKFQKSPQTNSPRMSSNELSNIRPINEATKFDSLEVSILQLVSSVNLILK